MTPEQSMALRAPFPASLIGKLPRKSGGHTVYLDYVGHAEVTDRLLEVDPEWNWEPMGYDERGLPVFVMDTQGNPVGLWVRLTIAGVTRIGFGSVAGSVFDPEKQLIGDALRNAAMRFGVALDLWAKSDLHDRGAELADPATGEIRGGVAQRTEQAISNGQAEGSNPSPASNNLRDRLAAEPAPGPSGDGPAPDYRAAWAELEKQRKEHEIPASRLAALMGGQYNLGGLRAYLDGDNRRTIGTLISAALQPAGAR